MTQDEQEVDYRAGRAWLDRTSSTLELDRCRHESVDVTTLWLFEHVPARKRGGGGNVQVGCVKRVFEPTGAPGVSNPWESTRMERGQPNARRAFATLDEALDWIEAYEHGRRRAHGSAY